MHIAIHNIHLTRHTTYYIYTANNQPSLNPGANLGKNAMLAFRILTSSGKIYLEYVVNKVS